ncbi:22091_t:CDS:2 [Gigaspora margarita]|uniref:22091_t:CDS:1 n=1 Tax=Gigaspora margarita TaxID=4874 RepID=A0ABN7VCA7_GIGMA|nr:22091_t:CDS:2 [Gigaspora margarita]
MLSSQDGENFFNEFIVEIKKSKNLTYEDIGLLSFLEFCDKRVALEVNDKRILHKKYLERLDAMILETLKRKNKNFPKEKLQLIRNNFRGSETTKLVSCQKLSGYKDNLADGNPKWFINKLNELSKYRKQILEYSLLEPFWCYIVDFGKEKSVWKEIYTKSLLDWLKTNCFQLNIKQIDDIIITVDQAYNDYNFSNEPPSIEIKSLYNFKQKSWAESILI